MSVAEIDRNDERAPDAAASHVDVATLPLRLLCRPVSRAATIGATFAALAVAAVAREGWLLLHVDEPIERFVVGARTSLLDTVFRSISFLGSTVVVLTGGALLAAVAWRRCRMVGLLVVVATLGRPPLEFTLKNLVGRERPSLDRMVTGTGYAFPSGHVLAAATLWMMVPIVLTLYVRSASVQRLATTLAATTVVLIGVSRIYLGVHWASDVVAGLLVAVMLLTALHVGFGWLHERRVCAGARMTHLPRQ